MVAAERMGFSSTPELRLPTDLGRQRVRRAVYLPLTRSSLRYENQARHPPHLRPARRALTAISFAGPRTLKRYGDDDSWRFARTAFNSSPVQLSLRQNLLSAVRDPGMQAPDAITGNGKDFDKNTAMTTDTNYSPTGLPTNTDDVRIIRTSATLTITTASVVMESLSATNGNTYTIGNNGFSGNRTLTLGNSSGFSNTWSGASNDLLYLAGNSTLMIQGPNLGANAQTLALTLASSGNFNVELGFGPNDKCGYRPEWHSVDHKGRRRDTNVVWSCGKHLLRPHDREQRPAGFEQKRRRGRRGECHCWRRDY